MEGFLPVWKNSYGATDNYPPDCKRNVGRFPLNWRDVSPHCRAIMLVFLWKDGGSLSMPSLTSWMSSRFSDRSNLPFHCTTGGGLIVNPQSQLLEEFTKEQSGHFTCLRLSNNPESIVRPLIHEIWPF